MTRTEYILAWVFVAVAVVAIIYSFPGCIIRPTPTDTEGEGMCAEACQNMERFQYPGWQGSPGEDEQHGTADDVECRVVCESTVAQGFPFHSKCLAMATDRSGMDRCYE